MALWVTVWPTQRRGRMRGRRERGVLGHLDHKEDKKTRKKETLNKKRNERK